MPNTSIDTDVLIVGAGPVGLFLANECARRGLGFRIIEARAAQSTQSKALAIFPRTLELLDMAGLVDPFLTRANRVASVAVVSNGRPLAKIPFAPEETPYPFIAMLPQNVTEQLLVDELRGAGGAVEYETSFVSATEKDDHVAVTLNQKGRPTSLRASFVVGCDGAHSAVRHLLALPFEGKEYDDSFALADIETNDALVAGELSLCPSAAGPLAVFPMSSTRARIVAIVRRELAGGDAPSLELVRELLAERAPSGLEARALHWSSYFRVHHRKVSRLHVGRIFIAGDAAHIHSPFGGQGMNTGLHDVWNLAWKLDLAVRGRAGPRLLESYDSERLPVIRQVIETTHLLTRVMGTPSAFAQALRDRLIPTVSHLAAFQSAFVTRLSGLGIRYGHGPLVDGKGERYFDDSMRGGQGICSRFLLMTRRDGSAASREAVRHFADAYGDVVEPRFVHVDRTVLVRPDGHVACFADGAGGTPSLVRMQSVLDRQVRRQQDTTVAPSFARNSSALRQERRYPARSAWS